MYYNRYIIAYILCLGTKKKIKSEVMESVCFKNVSGHTPHFTPNCRVHIFREFGTISPGQ